MTVRRGRCNNLGLCENATRQRTIEVPENEAFVCPKCGAELTSVADRASTRKASSLVVPLIAITLALAAVGYKVWDMYGRHPAPPMQQADTTPPPATAPVATATAPAAAPLPAPAPDTAPAVVPAPVPAPAAPVAAAPVPAAPVAQPAEPAAPPPAAATASTKPTPQEATPPTPEPTPAPEPAPAPPVVAAAPEPAPAPLSPAATDPTQRVKAFLGTATRVPVTFAFRSSAVTLNSRGEREIDRLVSYLKQHHAGGDRVYLAGFTDNLGDPSSNEAVAQKRVAAVAAALSDAGITPGHVASFGSDMPVADNATLAGRDRNRRVEVYLGQ